MAWSNGLAEWVDGDTAFLSVSFSWKLHEAYQKAIWYKAQGYNVRAGGVALFANKNFMGDVAEIGGEVDALPHHNPLATVASRGCPVGCWFCVVPKIEGKTFTLIPDFTPRQILCDNNLSALPVEYQDHIIEKYKQSGVELIDANSGFEPHTFNEDTYNRWKSINRGAWRFAFDETKESEDVERMSKILSGEPSNKKRVYVLVGNEPIAQCYERIIKTIELGCEPHVQAVLPLNAKRRDDYLIRFDWDKQKLTDIMRWANTWMWRKVKLWEYAPRVNAKPLFDKRMLLAD